MEVDIFKNDLQKTFRNLSHTHVLAGQNPDKGMEESVDYVGKLPQGPSLYDVQVITFPTRIKLKF